MEMPRNCAECPFCVADQYSQNYCCVKNDRTCDWFDVRDDDCPLEEVTDAKCEESPKVDSHAEYWDNIGSADMRGDV